MSERNYEEEARALVEAVLQEQILMHKSVDKAAEEYFEQKPEIEISKEESEELKQKLGEIPGFKMMPAEKFPPFQKLMEGVEKLKQKYGEELFFLVVGEGYNTKVGDSIEMLLPEHQWTDYTKRVYESLVKKVAGLLKQGKVKPLQK